MTTMAAKDPLNFDAAFANDIANGVQFADALEKHVTGTSQIRRAVCIQTLQALSALSMEDAQNVLMWAKRQQY